jgi:hypothetical protein
MDKSTETYLFSILKQIATRAAMGSAYKNWSDDFARKDIKEVWQNKSGKRQLTIKELASVNRTTLWTLGFGNWDGKIILIPLWVYNYIADGEELISINGKTNIVGKDDIDLDVRYGCIALGFTDD